MTAASQSPRPGQAAPVFTSRQIRRIRDVLARLSGARRSQRFYPVGHPAVHESAEGLMTVIAPFHDEGVDIPLTFFENEIMLGQTLLTEESVLFDQLVRDMSDGPANSVTFIRGLTAAELERALPLLAADSHGMELFGGLEAALAAANVPHVAMSTVKVYEREESEATGKEAAAAAYGGALDLMRELDRLIKTNRVASAERVRGVVRTLVDNVLSNQHALLELSGLKNYDEYTFFHSVNVAILSLALGSTLTSDRRFLGSLGVGALMHDIGKLSVAVDVLNKPGALSGSEWDEVRLHPLHGAEVAATMPGLDRSSIVVVLEHHMRYDVQGYPKRLPPRPQHLTSRIVAVADAYDAMTSRRSYSDARLQDEAMDVLARNAGTAFDPVLVRLFVQLMGVYPPRSVVRLSTGEIGIVIRTGGGEILRPDVRVLADAAGTIVEPHDIDLAAPGVETTIVSCLDANDLGIDVDDYL